MPYVKLDNNGVVIYSSVNNEPETIEAPAGVCCGFILSNGVFSAPPKTTAQQLAAEIQGAYTAGLTITSTSTPAVKGTYGIRIQDQQTINAVETFVIKNNAFPGSSGTSLAYQDIAGNFHVFPSLAIWSEFANAVANYVADLKMYAAGAPGSSLPSKSVTIA